MKPEDVERLKQHQDGVVRIACTDGEVLDAKIISVSDEYRDAIYELVSSTTPEKYPRGNSVAYVIKWADIVDFE
jgi:hypothetical protein